MTAGRPDNLSPELLAAYADGELPPAERARVERWLAADPEAREALDAQESFGPGNTEYWDTVAAPTPCPKRWREVLDRVVPPNVPARRAWGGWLGSLGLLATAATLVLALPGPQHPCLDPGPHPFAEVSPAAPADDDPVILASADEIRIISLPEAAAAFLLVGEHPMGDSAVVLADRSEIAFFGVGSDEEGRFPAVPSDLDAADSPMLWAPREP